MQALDGQQRFDAVFHGLADADQDSGGERHAEFAGIFDGLQSQSGKFVGRAIRRVRGRKIGAGALQHQSQAGIAGAQAFNPVRAQQAGIGVRQQAGFAQHQFAHGFQIMQRAAIAKLAQGFAHLGKQRLRAVAEREQRLGAAQLLACLRDRENFVGRHGVRARVAGIAAVGAVSAIIAAEVGQRDKHLARVGDDAGTILLLEGARSRQQIRQKVVVAAQELAGNVGREWLPVAHLAEMVCSTAPNCGFGWQGHPRRDAVLSRIAQDGKGRT